MCRRLESQPDTLRRAVRTRLTAAFQRVLKGELTTGGDLERELTAIVEAFKGGAKPIVRQSDDSESAPSVALAYDQVALALKIRNGTASPEEHSKWLQRKGKYSVFCMDKKTNLFAKQIKTLVHPDFVRSTAMTHVFLQSVR